MATYYQTYTNLRKSGNSVDETNDCSVIAVAAVCNKSYMAAHKALSDQGRKHRKGATLRQILDTVDNFGFFAQRVDSRYFLDQCGTGSRGRVRKNVTTKHPKRFPKVWKDGHTYLMSVRGHVLAIVNGEVVDWTATKSFRAQGIWRIIKKP